ncbi:synaptic vesicle glycoprotein 2Ba [Clarias gariepinus]|uniref:synaptic vesicle glycoprotein 2Ba n=1 Tax=Clarias gariepinus TaxID=13013 RepID=UPI00234CDA0D|nr:synaptic vesicle glycoprotein 2Ba [Clarias gariepinus]XP_053369717.1 synaptic vesicle glycoprotein 2Ba [Clarias gariepinus]
MDSHYQNNMQGNERESQHTYGEQGEHGYSYQPDYPAQDEDAASDATEGQDEDDQMYEGEYQGIPHPDEIKEARRTARREAKLKAKLAASEEVETLAEQYETIMEDCGHGRFQWTLFTVLGLALMADGVECFVVAFALPSAEKDMCLSNASKGMLGLIVYVGMMLGAIVWGGLADKLGRRQCLLNALAINCIFSFLSSFSPGYGFFLFCRLCSGIGIGASIPIVYTYFAEFLHMDKRGEHLSWLCLFWMLGGLYASFSAWGIIPHYGWGFTMGTGHHLRSWRVFVLVCFLPSVAALIGLVFMPESPRYLLENGRHDEAWMILRHVHNTNWRAKGEPEKVFQVSQFKSPQTQEDDFIEIQSETGTALQRFMVRQLSLIKQVIRNLMSLAAPNLRLHGLFIGIVWFSMAFSYYGLSVWFPDQIKHLQYEEYKLNTKTFSHNTIVWFHFNFSLKNQIHEKCHYEKDRFIDMEMRNVRFKECLFTSCYFEDISSTDTLFENCTITDTTFYRTDLYHDTNFINCNFINVTFLHPKEGCHINFQEENDILIYLVSFLGSLSVLPGNIIAGLLMDKIGRIKIIGSSMLMSSGCTFFLFLCFNPGAVISFQCLFYAASAAAWNGIDVITVELYPASNRATAFGVLNGLGKLAAIISTFIFSKFVGVTKIVPILLSFSAMACGGLLAFKLPETREVILQ